MKRRRLADAATVVFSLIPVDDGATSRGRQAL